MIGSTLLALTKTVAGLGATCSPSSGSFFHFPNWYDYLKGIEDGNGTCIPHVGSLSDIWLIVAAVISILLRIAALVTVAMIIYGGISYVTSQGEPEKTAQAKSTIVNALLGLAISIMAAFIISFIARSF